MALSKEKTEALLGTHPWQDRLTVLRSVPSTNRFARSLAKQGAPEGTVVLADAQTDGRGRLGRSFYSPAGEGLYLTVLLRPKLPPERLLPLTALAALAACDAVEELCKLHLQIKWTNDLVYSGKKIGGILTELALLPDQSVDHVILGFGINCLQSAFPPELPMAASLSMCGCPVDRNALAASLIGALYDMNARLSDDPSAQMRRFSERCVTLGKRVQIVRGDCRREAFAESVTDRGALVVRYDDGQTEAVTSGEVSVRGMYGYVDN